MFRTPLGLVVALLVTVAPTGCGTVFNVQAPHDDHQFSPTWEESRRIYGGVLFDVENLADCARCLDSDASLLFGPLILLDLPLSAAADTLTLPLTVPTTVGKLLWPAGATEPEGMPLPEKPAPVLPTGTGPEIPRHGDGGG